MKTKEASEILEGVDSVVCHEQPLPDPAATPKPLRRSRAGTNSREPDVLRPGNSLSSVAGVWRGRSGYTDGARHGHSMLLPSGVRRLRAYLARAARFRRRGACSAIADSVGGGWCGPDAAGVNRGHCFASGLLTHGSSSTKQRRRVASTSSSEERLADASRHSLALRLVAPCASANRSYGARTARRHGATSLR